jgi:NADH-ubiquinone oxidoreductase chain 1
LESELVSGFMTEHSAIVFVFFFLAEYASIILISILVSILFLGGYLYPFAWVIGQLNNPILEGVFFGVSLGLKTCLIVFMFIWVRASFPRIRYDQLMSFCWTVLLPVIFAVMFLVLTLLISFDAIPTNISGLFVPGLIAYNSNKVYKSKPYKLEPNYVTGF